MGVLAVITFASVTVAQSKKDKVEIGVQTTSLTLFDPDFGGDHTRPGVGGRITYNFNRSIAAEAEINYLPQRMARFDVGDTIIRYGEVSTESFSAREPILRRGVEYHHNVQVTSGFAFRF